MKRKVCHSLAGLFCTAVVLLGVLPTHAAAVEENIPVDAAHFPDAAFRDFITSAEYQVEEGSFPIDRDQDGQLSWAEREAVVSIVLGKDDPMGIDGRVSVDTNRYPIVDLTGIGYFPNLTDLQIGGRFDGDPAEYPSFLVGTVDLRDNQKLNTLILANGGASDVMIADRTFDTLDLHGNQVEQPDLSEQGETVPIADNYSVGEGKRAKHPIVCLDAGHYGKYNRSPVVPAYYESDMAWKLHLMLKEELEKYGIEVRTTRPKQEQDMVIVDRGLWSEGCDLFISIHSNADRSSYPDRPEGIHFVPRADSDIYKQSTEIAERLSQTVHEVMGTRQPARAYSRLSTEDRDGNGKFDDNYYGVLFGAQSVGTPGLILEHSFHTNANAANWLLQESNLRRMAVAEAKTIADWFEEREPEAEWRQDENGWRYEYSDGSYLANEWGNINGYWYHFDAKGYMQTGWQVVSGYWYHFAPSGYMQTGWQQIDGDWYYFSPSGDMQTGWQEIKGYRYYFGPSGAMVTGWQEMDGNRYYFAPGGDMQTGWQEIEGKRYYFTDSGAMATGWQEIGRKHYYFHDDGTMAKDEWIDGQYVDESGALVEPQAKPGWQSDEHGWQYNDADGNYVTGWQVINGYWYYFAEDGYMQTGWQVINGYWYYFAPSGYMQTGWQLVNGYWYYFAPGGDMQTGWQVINGYWYYFSPSGDMQTGWQVINGYWYYFSPGGDMQTGWQLVNGYWYYFAPGGDMQTGWQVINGYWYYFSPSGDMQTGWQWIHGYCYYFYPSGYMATNTWIGGSYVNGSGAWVK